ncbi:MAG TPA: hypothetical protein PKW36_14780, partial [bacterium]|nr:hypothetical protein [bacterium]
MKRRLWIHTIIALSTLILTVVLHQRIGRAGIDANTSLRLRLKKPDIIDARFIAGGNWYYVMRNQGAFMYDRGDWDNNGNNAGGAFPRGSGATVVYAAGPWIGAIKNGVPVVSETQFASEFQPGRILNSGVPFEELIADSVDNPLNQVYVVDRNTTPNEWTQLPSEFKNQYGNSPSLIADVQAWTVFNDLDTTLSQETSHSSPFPGLGLEITLESMTYDIPFVNNSVLLHYTIVNKTNTPYTGAYFGLWMDADVNGGANDVKGSDSVRALGYVYNVDNFDAPLAVGFDILQGPVVHKDSIPSQYAYKFQNNTTALRHNPITKRYEPRTLGNDSVFFAATTGGSAFKHPAPLSNSDRYNLLSGLYTNGTTDMYLINGWFCPGNPVTGTGLLHMFAADQRMLVATGPFRMEAGGSQEIWAAVVGGEGTDRLDAVANLFQNDDVLQSAFT